MERAVSKAEAESLRYERKFVFPDREVTEVLLENVWQHSYGFQEIYTQRTVNNIYFDDFQYQYYHQNVAGDGLRKKIRLRWYGAEFSKIRKPSLEVKKKTGDVGSKLSYPLADFHAYLLHQGSIGIHNQMLEALDTEALLPLRTALEPLSPALYNSYDRRYFLSACKRFRITIDFNMRFYDPLCPSWHASEVRSDDTVLELKYQRSHDAECRQLSQEFTARLSKHSKYVRGMEFIRE